MSLKIWVTGIIVVGFFLLSIYEGWNKDMEFPVTWVTYFVVAATGYTLGLGLKLIKNLIF